MTIVFDSDRVPGADRATAIRMPAMANRDTRLEKQATVRRHSRFVRRMRVMLPVASGLIAVSVLGFALIKAALPGIDLGPLNLESGGLVMTNPRLNGHSDNGRAYRLEATRARQPIDDPKTIHLEGVNAFSEMADNDSAKMVARKGIYRSEREFLELREAITVITESGYTIRSEVADVDMAAGTLVAPDTVTIVSDSLDLRADSATVTDEGKVITFRGNVKIIWQRASVQETQ